MGELSKFEGIWGAARIFARFSPYLVSYGRCGRDTRDPRGICNNLGCTLEHDNLGRTHWRGEDSPAEEIHSLHNQKEGQLHAARTADADRAMKPMSK